jgi:hypothetical protein
MSVEIAEVAGVDPPRAIVSGIGDGCPGRGRTPKQGIDLRATRGNVPEAEFARLGRPDRHLRVLRQLRARVEGQGQGPGKLEHHDGAGRRDVVSGELLGDHTGRFEPEDVPVEGKRPLQVGDGERDDVDQRRAPFTRFVATLPANARPHGAGENGSRIGDRRRTVSSSF